MQIKPRDPRYSTPESLAAADEYNAASIAVEALSERLRKNGVRSVPADELAAAVARLDAAVANLPIPSKLMAYNPADWRGRDGEHEFSTDAVHRHAQYNQARVNWCIAHGIWTGLLDELIEEKQAAEPIEPKGKPRARTRRSKR